MPCIIETGIFNPHGPKTQGIRHCSFYKMSICICRTWCYKTYFDMQQYRKSTFEYSNCMTLMHTFFTNLCVKLLPYTCRTEPFLDMAWQFTPALLKSLSYIPIATVSSIVYACHAYKHGPTFTLYIKTQMITICCAVVASIVFWHIWIKIFHIFNHNDS